MEGKGTLDIPEGSVYIVRVIPCCLSQSDDVFSIWQAIDYAERLDADNATTILGELVHLAAHLDLATNPIHNDLAGTSLSLHFFKRRSKPFQAPRGQDGMLVIDLVRRHVHVHRDIIWPERGLFEALRGLDFQVCQTKGRWRQAAYQNLWLEGKLAGSYPRSPLAKMERGQVPIQPTWINPRYCREVVIPYPSWPPKPVSPNIMAQVARWTPKTDTAMRYTPALAKLNPASEAYALGQFLSRHDVDEVADWFETFAPLCYEDDADPRHVLSTVLSLESQSIDGEALAGALVWLAAKMQRLGYRIPAAE